MIVWLIRHGLTAANAKHLYCGKTDLPLSVEGRNLLRRIDTGGISAQRFITSGMRRCVETMSLLFPGRKAEAVADLREIDFGIFEMHCYDDLKDTPAYQVWITGDNEKNIPPGGESGEAMISRVRAAFDRILSDGQSAVIVTHGGVISAVMAYLFPEEKLDRYSWQPKPGEGYEVSIDLTNRTATYRKWKGSQSNMKSEWRNKKPEECRYSFFQHRDCEFFPCHQTERPEDFNCLFCYCPLYALGSKCGGNFRYLDNGFKDCSSCLVPHRRSSYSYVISKYPELAELAKNNK